MGYAKHHLRIVEGRPWKQALVCALNPEAPYRPWKGLDPVTPGDTVLVVIDTDPRTVLCAFTWDGLLDGRHAIAGNTCGRDRPLQSLTKVEDAVGISLAGDRILNPRTARALVTTISNSDFTTPSDRAGHSSVAIGRIMMSANRSCTLCHDRVVIASEQDVDRLVPTAEVAEVAEVYARADWPALLCPDCAQAMSSGGFTAVVDLVFSRHPACPRCSARQACRIGYGLPHARRAMNLAPWESLGGCVVLEPGWHCRSCGNKWDSSHLWPYSTNR